MQDLPIIQKTYDLIKWYVPILNRLPRDHKFQLGDRLISGLYDLLENLIFVRYQREKLPLLEPMNSRLDVLRHQTRLLLDFGLIEGDRYEYAGKLINGIGTDLSGGSWINNPRNCRSAYRNNNNPDDRNNNLGFRVLCSVPALFYVRTGRWESIGRIYEESRSVPAMCKHPKNKRVSELGKS